MLKRLWFLAVVTLINAATYALIEANSQEDGEFGFLLWACLLFFAVPALILGLIFVVSVFFSHKERALASREKLTILMFLSINPLLIILALSQGGMF